MVFIGNRKRKNKKIKFNYFIKRKMIIGIGVVLIFLSGIITTLIFTDKDDKKLVSKHDEVEKSIPAECPYTLDELEYAITSGWLFDKKTWREYGEEANNMAFILFHFYDYFSKETEFTVFDEVEGKTGEVISYRKINYDEYMEHLEMYFQIIDISFSRDFPYIGYLRSFMYDFIKMV